MVLVKFVPIRVIGVNKNHRRKIMLTMVTKIFYNRLLTEAVLCCIACVFLARQCSFFFVFVIAVAHGSVRISIPQKRTDKPNKQHQRHNNGHNHVPDLVAKVHKYTNNVKCFCQ